MNAVIDLQRLVPAWQALQSAVPLAHIEIELDYERAMALLNSLLDAVRDDAGHPVYSLVSVVGDLIEAYEIDREPGHRERQA
jgi:HTH-type transcriptional regulator/antitoxin HigA